MRVLIVGGTGLIGSEIVKLLSAEHEIVTASRKGSDLPIELLTG